MKYKLPELQASGLNQRFPNINGPFSEYVAHMRDVVERARLDLEGPQAEHILDVNSPFEWLPDPREVKSPRKGMLLVHGLYDSPYVMHSIAEHFRKQNYWVRNLLLPGHGTVPGDLLDIKYQEWQKAVQFGVDSFQGEVDQLFICGYSTGAILAINQAYKHNSIAGVICLAPAIAIKPNLARLIRLNNWLHNFHLYTQWYGLLPMSDYAKYQSFCCNAPLQVHKLGLAIKQQSQKQAFTTPIFMCMATSDELISVPISLNFFNACTSAHKRFFLYCQNPELEPLQGPNIFPLAMNHADKNIIDYSHVSLAVAPNHPHYGELGDFRDYAHYERKYGKLYSQRCADKPKAYGALNPHNLNNYHLQRLTFNPDFANMMQRIDDFIAELPFDSNTPSLT